MPKLYVLINPLPQLMLHAGKTMMWHFLILRCRKNGLVLAKKLKDIYKDTNIVFVTGYSQYALDAHRLHCSGQQL